MCDRYRITGAAPDSDKKLVQAPSRFPAGRPATGTIGGLVPGGLAACSAVRGAPDVAVMRAFSRSSCGRSCRRSISGRS